LHGALGKETFLKKIKTVCADGLCQVCSAHDFLKKIEKQSLSTAFAKGFRRRFFLKKTSLFADGPSSRPSAKMISKTVNLTRR
jgi:hypothetical protein